MTPQRALELINHRTMIGNVSCHTSWVGDLDKHMTKEERTFVNSVWDKMPGNTNFMDALHVIAKPIL